MSKGSLLRSVASIYVMLCVMFLCQSSAFADEVEPAWTTLASMSTSRCQFQTEVINGKIYTIGGPGIIQTESYDPTVDSWTILASMSTDRQQFQTEVIDGKIYAIGGYSKLTKQFLSSAEVYDPSTNIWTTLAPMSIERTGFQTVVLNDKIYAIGGTNSINGSSTGYEMSAEVYDPSTDTWTTLASMTTGRNAFQVEVVNGKIYVIGGASSGKTTEASAEVYDPSTNSWTTIAPMSITRANFQTKVLNGKIYAFGGNGNSDYLNTAEVYDPSINTWTTIAPMSLKRNSFNTEVINGKIYVIGGYSKLTIQFLSSAEVYDPSTNSWTTLTSMNTGRGDFQSEEINGKIYVIGGMGKSYSQLSSLEVYTVTTSSDNQLEATAGNSRVDLTWDAVTKATSYTIKRATTAGGPYTSIATDLTETSYTDTDVTNGTTYYYVVTAIVNGSEGWNSNEASATPQASTDPNEPTGNKALLVITMVTGERKEYEMTTDKINDFITWYNSKAASSPTYVIEKEYNKASFTTRKDFIAYEQISNFEVNEYND